ncbi:MAG: class I SAM-dependent methyltransferase [Acetobacteraceae bacterium]
MGDIFRREAAEHPEPFTGERLTTAVGGQVRIEHYHRYLFARALAAGLDVLDVASGEGYGAALLAQVARRVVGVEFSGATVRTAAANFPRDNLHFLQGDARALPLPDAAFDLAVSFETIEHFDRQDEFLREVRRVLRPGGSLIVSTPDRDIYSPAGAGANPFHVRELSRSEFVALLHESFRHVQVIQQRALIGSALLADGGGPAPPLVFERRGETHFEACTGLPRAPYLVALASDCAQPPAPASLYVDRGDLDTETLQRIALGNQIRQVQAELQQVRQDAETAAREADRLMREATDAAAGHLREAARRTEQAALRADEAAERARAERQRVESAEARCGALEREHDRLQGSLRVFLRGYVPRLRRHLLGRSAGQRP